MGAKNFDITDEQTTDLAVETFLAEETTCCLCGTTLNFDHKIDYLTLKIIEDAHCPSCQIQMKSKEHKLQ